VMDINDMDFVEQFDVVFSNATLHWVKDHASCSVTSTRALCVGGRLLFNFAERETASHFL
jgi:trans-aconitate methyltransferase